MMEKETKLRHFETVGDPKGRLLETEFWEVSHVSSAYIFASSTLVTFHGAKNEFKWT